MSQREDFIRAMQAEGVKVSQVCREYGISRKTGYKWLKRFRQQGAAGLQEQSRRPQHSPRQTAAAGEAVVVAARQAHPAWGARKLKRWLENQGQAALPALSTISSILRRHQLLDGQESLKHRPYQRFAMERPNQLWQMDFKGHFPLGDGQVCHPLTVLDDHSRFLLGLHGCRDETTTTVPTQLTQLFRTYGLPERMLMDNGSPWGDDGQTYTRLTVWLLWLDIAVSHGRPYHPQTQGKEERLHRTLKAELLNQLPLPDAHTCQAHFDRWRDLYNWQRPHQALDLAVPASRYQPSPRPFPDALPPLTYDQGDAVRKVDSYGKISFRTHKLHLGRAFADLSVALRPHPLTDGCFQVFFRHTCIHTFEFRVLQ